MRGAPVERASLRSPWQGGSRCQPLAVSLTELAGGQALLSAWAGGDAAVAGCAAGDKPPDL